MAGQSSTTTLEPERGSVAFGGRARPDFEAGVKALLDSHGYSFQHAMLKAFDEVVRSKRLDWQFDVSEFPVSNAGHDTRIDFICDQRRGRMILVCECKRANPALANWVFLNTPIRTGHFADSNVAIEYLLRRETGESESRVYTDEPTDNSFDLSIESRGREPGDAASAGRGDIERACTQLIRGQQGYFRFLALLAPPQAIQRQLVVPVLFTTAALWTGDPNLASASVTDGILAEAPALTRQPWVWYQFPLSESLRHPHKAAASPKDASDALRNFYTRSIAVVNASGLGPFLQALSHLSPNVAEPD